MIQDVSIKYRVCQQRHCHNNHTHKLKSIKTSRSLTHGTQLTSYIIATMMSNRRYQTILLLLLLLHAITVHSFSNDAAAIITGAMTMNSKLLAWQAAVVVRRSLLYRSTHHHHHRRHHGRGGVSLYCGQGRQHQHHPTQRPFSIINKEEKEEDGTAEAEAAAAATHWFTYALPEGYCVGVVLSADIEIASNNIRNAASASNNDNHTIPPPSSVLSIKEILHPQEYQWGITNHLSSPVSRRSYYLGRVALRLALKRLLLHVDVEENVTVGMDDESVVSNNESMVSNTEQPAASKNEPVASNNESTTTTTTTSNDDNSTTLKKRRRSLYNTITSNPIQKDSHGRPILPEMVVGSISHKGGECAVGLARFHPLFYESESVAGGGVDGGVGSGGGVNVREVVDQVQWREDCPIYYDDDDDDCSFNNNNNNSRERIGIGVDIEYIDGVRGERIKRRILTEKERSELGGLVDELGISIGEEVMLRFSLKESVYKAMHPILCEYVGFQEAEITPLPDGTAKVILNLQSGSHERLGIVVRNASWRRLEGGRFFLTTALVGVDSTT